MQPDSKLPSASPRGLGRLVDLSRPELELRELALDGTVCARMCDVLRSNDTVTSIDLSSNRIGDRGAEQIGLLLQENTNIVTLNLRNNDITDWGVGAIVRGAKRHRKLQSLDVAGNAITDMGLAEIAKLLQGPSQLREIVLTDTKITFSGAVAFAQAMLGNDSLLYLTLPFTLGAPLINELEKLLKRNWMKAHKYDAQIAAARALTERMSAHRAMKQRQWRPSQPASDPPTARTRTCASDMEDWCDPAISATTMYLAVLDRKMRSTNAGSAATARLPPSLSLPPISSPRTQHSTGNVRSR